MRLLTTASLLLVSTFACSTPAPNPAATTGDASPATIITDASSTPDVAVADLPTCGMPPYVTLGIVVREAVASGEGAVVPGARLTTSLCPGTLRLSGDDGMIRGRVSKGVPFYARFEAKNFAPTLIAEQSFAEDKSPIVAPLPPSIFTVLVPGFGPTASAIAVGVMHDGGKGPCNALDGVHFEVDGHPEAKVTYFSNDPIPMVTGGTATTASGRAIISSIGSGLGAGVPFVTVVGTKAGCTVSFSKAPYTGRSPLEAGFLTLAPAYLHD